ncbi:hypothetical protein [Streptomyces sp. CA-111067]|uniref:hypothetical protein n=1 Tax=Streptomyces sp. CA-111067 TaxID=3240046 RepID=UPI003D99E30C
MRFATARTAGAVWLVLVAAAVTACGDGGGSGGGGATARAAAPGSTSPATSTTSPATSPATPPTGAAGPIGRTLSQQELYTAFVTSKELPGWSFGGPPVQDADHIVNVSRLPAVSPAACAPLSRMTSGLAANHQPRAYIELNADAADPDKGAILALTSYAPAAAPKVLDDLRASLKTCRTFPFDEGISVTEPKRLAAPAEGDEALAYELTQVVQSIDEHGDPDGGAPVRVPIQFKVVRVGTVIAAFWALSVVGEHSQVPPELVAAQVAKLNKTAARGRPTTT